MADVRGSLRLVVAVVGVMALAAGGLALRPLPSTSFRPLWPAAVAGGAVDEEQVRSGLVKAPLSFVANTGALDERVAFWVPGSSASVYLTDAGLIYRLSAPRSSSASVEPGGRALPVGPVPSPPGWVVRQDFVGAAAVRPVAVEAAPTTVNFFKGSPDQWRTSVPTASSVGYTGLWPGIDATYAGTGERLKYEFTVARGADPAAIRLAYRGAERVTLTPGGELAVESPVGGFTDAAPTAYQDLDGRRVPVEVSYALDAPEADGSQPYRFALGSYDTGRPLVIDPATIVYAGFIGGSDYDVGSAIAVDAAGAAYVTGSTGSTAGDIPVVGGPDLTANGQWDAFVAKVAPGGAGLVYAGFIGGSSTDAGRGIAVDAAGAAYVTGFTSSTGAGFPVVGSLDATANGGEDAFVAKVAPGGASLVYAGFIGGSGYDFGSGIAVDGAGAAYVTGQTSSTEATFPETGGPDLTANGGSDDAFVAKVAPGGTGLVYAGFIGGSETEGGWGIGVDAAGAAYVTGRTDSNETTFPAAVGPDLTSNGNSDAFVAKVAPGGTGLVYAGFIGGSSTDAGHGIAVDAAGSAYVTGYTHSIEAFGFPVVVGPDLTANGDGDAFVAKVTHEGASLAYAGFIGGGNADRGWGIAVDAAGAAYVTGETSSTEATFPETGGPDLTANGNSDAFVAKVAPGGAGLVYAGFIGGSDTDVGAGIAVDAAGAAYVTGETYSTEATFPEAVGPDLTANGTNDAFVAKVVVKDGSAFHPLVPTRILDSRPPPSQVGPFSTPWGQSTVRDVTVTGAGVPVGADAVTLNVTVTGTTGAGFLTIWPKGQPQPVASSLNWAPGQTIPNAVTVKVGAGGQISIANPVGSTQVIIDAVGYYDNQSGDGYTPLDPTRILDSRPAPNQVGPFNTPWAAGETRNVTVTGGVVPATADAVVLNVTVTSTTAAGFLTIWPTGQHMPTASSLNWAPGDTIPNAVTVKVGASGSIAVFNQAGNANVIIDVVGSFSAGTGALFHPVTPARILDSRPPPNQVGPFNTPWGPTTTRDLQVTGNGGIPAGATAALLNVTITNPTATSFLTIWPAGQATPTASSLNWVAGQTIPNAVTTKLAASGAISIRNFAGAVDVIADTAGWYG